MIYGCCLGRVCEKNWFTLDDANGIPRWPASQVEFVFNAVALAVILFLRGKTNFSGQLFHLYLMGYGAFRFFHEFSRDTPPMFLKLSGYQFIALAIVALGAWRFWQRAKKGIAPPG
jgi:phosphatidylglycerol:prolipoprotein diacylglycerol transferase